MEAWKALSEPPIASGKPAEQAVLARTEGQASPRSHSVMTRESPKRAIAIVLSATHTPPGASRSTVSYALWLPPICSPPATIM